MLKTSMLKTCPHTQMSLTARRGSEVLTVCMGGRGWRGARLPRSSGGLSLNAMLTMSGPALTLWCFDAGFLQDRRGEECPKCHTAKLKLHATKASYSCSASQSKCRHEETCTRREAGLFLEKAPLGKQMQVIYGMVRSDSQVDRLCAFARRRVLLTNEKHAI